MNRLSLLAVACLTFAGCWIGPGPPPPTKYDRAFDAAAGAASDVGVEVRTADHAAGRIIGTKDGAEVTIDVRRQPDGTVKVEFTAPGATETPKLSDRWLQAYNRRMGR
jgi:hypothetical protein